ncbi:MAG: hypothetical protein ABL994_03715 [Verrucomicrobiales bacterium]
MDVTIPCRCRISLRNEELFEAGIIIEDEKGNSLARIYLPESSRNQGFSRHLGFFKNPKHYELCLEVGGTLAVRLVARARHANSVPQNEIFTASGESAGKIEVKLSAMRVPTRRDRATVRDASGQEVGYFELAAGLLSVTCKFVDQVRGWDYEMLAAENGLIRSETAKVIDARLLLAWVYYTRFYLEALDE